MPDNINCYDCGSEFNVHPSFDIEEPVSFCPYCGGEIEHEQDDDFDDTDDYEDYRH